MKTIKCAIALFAAFSLLSCDNDNDEPIDGDEFKVVDIIKGVKETLDVTVDAGGESFMLEMNGDALPIFYSESKFEYDDIVEYINDECINRLNTDPKFSVLSADEFVAGYNAGHKDAMIKSVNNFYASWVDGVRSTLHLFVGDGSRGDVKFDGLRFVLRQTTQGNIIHYAMEISADPELSGKTVYVQLAVKDYGVFSYYPLILIVDIK